MGVSLLFSHEAKPSTYFKAAEMTGWDWIICCKLTLWLVNRGVPTICQIGWLPLPDLPEP